MMHMWYFSMVQMLSKGIIEDNIKGVSCEYRAYFINIFCLLVIDAIVALISVCLLSFVRFVLMRYDNIVLVL